MHLGMSGWFRIIPPAARQRADHQLTAHDHVVFAMSSGATVVFNDPRRFGFMKVVPAGGVEPGIAALGPEPLDRSFSAAALARALRGRRTSLKAALLDQRIVAGLGNIYVSEALHGAGVSPKRRAATLVDRQGEPRPSAHALVDGIKASLRDAIANRHRADGDDRFLVYGHDGERCPRRGCGGVVKRIVQNGRASFFCPACQR
jgi:formamidopyrimidine-DNA glycosylase